MSIRDATPSDFAKILRMNEESVHFLSPLDKPKLEALHEAAIYHRVFEKDGEVAAFLLVLSEGAEYDSPNYLWFSEHYDHFLYIDRVVVSLDCQGQRLGNHLYEDLFMFAKENGFGCIACEFDIDPPNEGSRRFHQRFGFREVGSQFVADGKKQVSLQVVSI